MKIILWIILQGLVCAACFADGGSGMKALDVALAGDLLGHIVGTVSTDEGAQPAVDAEVNVSGSNPLGSWRRSARSDSNGIWQVDLPLGTDGQIVVNASTSDAKGNTSIDARDISKRLTPRPSASSQRISLDGRWRFAIDPPESFPTGSSSLQWKTIDTPSHWEMEGFVAESGRAAYSKSVAIPAGWANKRIKIGAGGIYSQAAIWVNGHRVGGHVGATPFEVDITDAVKPGEQNELAILVHAESFASEIDKMSFYAYWNLAGIWRPIEVFCVEPAHVSRIALNTDFDEHYKDADLSVEIDISNEQPVAVKDAELSIALRDAHGKAVRIDGFAQKVTLGPWETMKVSLKGRVTAPEQWTAETPRLYSMTTKLAAPGQPVGKIAQRVGFKQVEIKNRTYLINGQPEKFWGTNRLDAHPLMGRAVTTEVVKKDLDLIKGCNLNALRSHFCMHPATPEYADEIGLYIEDEAPFMWVSSGMFGPEKPHSTDLRYLPFFIGTTSALLERDRNHASVSVWSLCNESSFGRNLALTWEWVKKSDPTRPCSAGQSGNLEIATYHNPTSMQRLKDTAGLPMPVLYDEGMAIFHGWGMAAGLELDPGLRDYWVTAHIEPRDGIYAADNQMGVMIWAWVDDAALVPGRGIRYWRADSPKMSFADRVYRMPGRGIIGDYMWGTVDGWRRPRPEWWLTKKLFSPIQIAEKPLAIPEAGRPIIVPVENRSTFTNLKDFPCKWSIASQSGEVHTDVAAHSKGEILIPATSPQGRGKNAPADQILKLEFFSAAGDMVDGYNLAFKAHEVPKAPWSGQSARIVMHDRRKSLSYEAPVRFLGKDCTLEYDRSTGLLLTATAGREVVLVSGPSLHVLNNAAPSETTPGGWRFASGEVDADGVLSWKGAYGAEFTGGYRIRMDEAGDIVVEYDFAYSGAERASREIGLQFELPIGFEHLTWDRRAEWSYYPTDHIGRPSGSADSHPKVAQTIPPGTRPYGLDDHPWGSNDFRSTKRNIYSAGLISPLGAGVEVISNGTQHVRATVGVNSVSLKVLDYYGGSATGINEYDGAYGTGRVLKPGDTVKGEVRLRLVPPSHKP